MDEEGQYGGGKGVDERKEIKERMGEGKKEEEGVR